MKILYAIQGTGNGHLARATDIYPELCAYGEVDVLISGVQADLHLPFPVKYQLQGLSFIFGNRGGINKWATFRKMNLPRLIADIFQLPVHEYDLVVNDFEPVSAWSSKMHKTPCIALSHQAAVMYPDSPQADNKDIFGKFILKYYAPAGTKFGFHFKSFGEAIFTPVIRRQVRDLVISDKGHYTVYLPSYNDNTLVKELSVFPSIRWEVFSKHCSEAFTFKNINVYPIENNAFLTSMSSSSGVLCGAGFETPAEALFLNKKLMVIPMSGQYEQQCNAVALMKLGVPAIEILNKKNRNELAIWLDSGKPISVHYPDNTKMIVAKLMETFWASQPGRYRLA